MDGTLLKELQAVVSDPRVKRTPTDEARKERARTLCNILALLTTKDQERWYEKYQTNAGTKRTEVSS